MITESQERIKRYVSNSRHYMENALGFLQRGDTGKASEFLWGSTAEALQAVAASRGIRLANHRSLRYFASTISKELKDPSIVDGFRHAEALHANFYEVELEPVDIAAALEPIRVAIGRLLALIPGEALEQAQPDIIN